MSTVQATTTADRVKFMQAAMENMSDLNKIYVSTTETLYACAQKIGVSAIFKATNILGEMAEESGRMCESLRSPILEMLDIYKKDSYNVGNYKDLVNKAITSVSQLPKMGVEYVDVSMNSDAQEDVSPANIATLDDALTKFSKSLHNTLMEISAVAGNAKNDDNKTVKYIGKSCETITNNGIAVATRIHSEIESFAHKYKIQLASLENLAIALNSKVKAADVSTSITFED